MAVEIEIGQEYAQTFTVGPEAIILGRVDKRTVTAIDIQAVGQTAEQPRRTGLAMLGGVAFAKRVILPRPVDVVGDVQIVEPIAVQVAPGCAAAPQFIIESGGARAFNERSIALV